VRANFRVVDALDLAWTTFETVIDSGLFHVLTDDGRLRFLPSLSAVLRPGENLFDAVLQRSRDSSGTQAAFTAEIHATFHTGWTINYIQPATFVTTIHEGRAKAWLAFYHSDEVND
jgi:hypothetical protein